MTSLAPNDKGTGQCDNDLFYRNLLESLPFPVVLLDNQNRFVWLNYAGESFFESSLSILLNAKLDRFIQTDSQLFVLIRRARQSNSSVEDKAARFFGPRLNGATATVLLVPVDGLGQGSILMTIQTHTVAEQMATQKNFKGAALSMSRMSALLAHEIKNPLAGIKGAAQLLEMELPKSQHELSSMIVDEADRITSLLQRIENMSSDAPVHFEELNIHEIIDHGLKVTSASFGRHLDIERQYDPSLPYIWADREMLIQCFINLFKNASEACNKGDRLKVTTSYSLTRYTHAQTSGKIVHLPLQIDVEDTGQGISDDLKAHIFEPFVSNKSGGSGLGLAMVASVVADHGGAITVQSDVMKTCFSINLPIGSEKPISDPIRQISR